jgi:exodeoxyribonuclease V beta subunit
MVREHNDLLTNDGKNLAMPLVRQVVLADLVARIIQLLETETITVRDGSRRAVLPGDIAVLVPTHAEAANVAEALRRAKVPAVRTRTGSVLDTPAVLQWRLLLAALARPHHGPTVRAAALGWFFATDAASLVGPVGDATMARLQEQCASYADRMRRMGVAAAYDTLKSTSGLVRGVVARDGGDRDLTDLDHLAELLAQRTHRTNTEPAQVLRLLEDVLVNGDDRSEETMRRVESDVQSVQITTIHAAKGLEYPIVLAPFAFKCRNDLSGPLSYTDGDERTIDIASLVSWSDGGVTPGARKRWAEEGNDGDALRLLYVALTRARHRLELWWACATRWQSSPLARLLLDRDDARGPVVNSCRSPGDRVDWKPPFHSLPRSEVEQRVRALVAASGGLIALTELPEKIAPAVWTPGSVDDVPPLTLASRGGRHVIEDAAWRRWSFTGLSRHIGDGDAAAHAAASTDAPVRGGADEPAAGDADTGLDAADATAQGLSFANVPGSARFGTFVHTLLEGLDFTVPDLEHELAERVSRGARRDGLRVDEPAVVAGLAAAIHTPLGGLFAGRSLRDIGRADRLDELSFDLPLAHSGPGRHLVSFAAGEIAAVLLDELAGDDPLRPSLTALAADLSAVDIAGWMYGSIDAVIRIVTDHPRFFVVDYKTNRLHAPDADDPLSAYAASALPAAMAAHHYPLQAVLYLVALHRYLRWRLGASYDPDLHLGGVGYLFLRGMAGPASTTGVFSWRPATSAVLALDRLFALGRAA